jgi:hypothetical protein
MALPANPQDRRIKTRDSLQMGKLLKSWATGRDYVNNPQHPRPDKAPAAHPRPASFKEFVEQCALAGVTLTYDDANETIVDANDQMGFVMLQGDTSTLVIRLSAEGYIYKSEDALLGMNQYPLTQFYQDVLVSTALKPETMDTDVHKMETHAKSLADYTIRTCI